MGYLALSSGSGYLVMTGPSVSVAGDPSPVVPIGTLTTGDDTIPNFGAATATVDTTGVVNTSIATGVWSSASTWSQGRAPRLNDILKIANGHTVTVDGQYDYVIPCIAVQSGGTLKAARLTSSRIKPITLLVLSGGTLDYGTAASPIPDGITAEVVYANVPINTTVDPKQYGNGLLVWDGGIIRTYGLNKTSHLRATVATNTEMTAGDTTVQLTGTPTNWKAGDKLILPDSRHLLYDASEVTGAAPLGREVLTLASTASSATITFTPALAISHPGARAHNNTLDYNPHIGNLTRNVVFRSEDANQTRGHTFFTHRADIDMRYAEFRNLGRTTTSAIDDAVPSSNQRGRYPIHCHHVIGPTGLASDVPQFNIEGCSVWDSGTGDQVIKWGLTVHDSHYGQVKNNVVYNWGGAGIYTEDAASSYNVVEGNFVVLVRGGGNPRSGVGSPDQGSDGSCIWLNGYVNYIRNNVAANGLSITVPNLVLVAGGGFNLQTAASHAVDTLVPDAKGNDPDVNGHLIDPQIQPLLEFSGNETYCNSSVGLTLWQVNSDGFNFSTGTSGAGSGGTVLNQVIWHCREEAYFGYPVDGVTFDGMIVRGHPRQFGGLSPSLGFLAGDYWQSNITLIRCDFQGLIGGFGNTVNAPGIITIEDSNFICYQNGLSLRRVSAETSGVRPKAKAERTTRVKNCTFTQWTRDTTPSGTYKHIEMNFHAEGGGSNYIASDRVFVTKYQGSVGDNFRLYYTQQAPGYVVPHTSSGIIGSPDSGRTNQQNLDDHGTNVVDGIYGETYPGGFVIAGKISPTTNTRTGITGYVNDGETE